jgi:diacylglycerol kinase
MTSRSPHSENRSWRRKLADALRGLKVGVRGQSSFFVHFFAGAAVIVAAMVLDCTRLQWCVLVLCIAGVLACEMFNSALEQMAKAIDREDNPHLADALDIGSAAVLIASIGAAVAGTVILGYRLGVLLRWWA